MGVGGVGEGRDKKKPRSETAGNGGYSIIKFQYSIFNIQYSIFNFQLSIFNFQFSTFVVSWLQVKS